MSSENKRIIITGGPGSGKSKLVGSLRAKGFPTANEAESAIIRDQVAIGGHALPWKDRATFADLILNWEMRSWHAAEESRAPFFFGESRAPFFFDGGLPDVVGYLELCNLPVPVYMEKAIELFRYAPTVFLTPPWEEIFLQDIERKQSYLEAIQAFNAIVESYNRHGYQLIRLPLCGVEERAEFILSSL